MRQQKTLKGSRYRQPLPPAPPPPKDLLWLLARHAEPRFKGNRAPQGARCPYQQASSRRAWVYGYEEAHGRGSYAYRDDERYP